MAITHENSVLIEYFVANRNHSKLQKIRPQRIDRSRGSPHVEAHSMWEDTSRVFNIANIKAIRLTEDENTTGLKGGDSSQDFGKNLNERSERK